MRTVLLTGFEPFAGDRVNPSALAAEALAGERLDDARLVAAVLPVSYARAGAALRAAMTAHAPDAVLAVGQAAGRAEISLERIAINLDDARLPDNDGELRVDVPVVQGAPAAYFAAVPVKAMAARIRASGVPAGVSHSAGSFLCNHVFYLLCHEVATRLPTLQAGLVHVPALPEQVAERPGQPSMALSTIVGALREAIRCLDTATPELRVAEGATH
jgi:pyroglutamyl-peptidase